MKTYKSYYELQTVHNIVRQGKREVAYLSSVMELTVEYLRITVSVQRMPNLPISPYDNHGSTK